MNKGIDVFERVFNKSGGSSSSRDNGDGDFSSFVGDFFVEYGDLKDECAYGDGDCDGDSGS